MYIGTVYFAEFTEFWLRCYRSCRARTKALSVIKPGPPHMHVAASRAKTDARPLYADGCTQPRA
jgi:hypothetical protein